MKYPELVFFWLWMAVVENVSVFRADSQQQLGKLLATCSFGIKEKKAVEDQMNFLPLATKDLVADGRREEISKFELRSKTDG